MTYIKNYLIDFDNKMYLTVDSLMDINNIATGSNNIFLRNINVKQCGYDKMYMNKDLIENKLQQLIDQFNELFDNIHPFYDGNGRSCKIFFANFN